MSDVLTQTQHFPVTSSQLVRPPVDSDVVAWLVSLTDLGRQWNIKREQKEIDIGRHPDCYINVKDKRTSTRHIRIYRDERFHYFVEQLSQNASWCNDYRMEKGNTRALQHGDCLSLLVHADQKPPAAFIFRLSRHQSDPDAVSTKASPGKLRLASTASMTTPALETKLLVTDEWVNENWDMRTTLGTGNFSEVRLGVQVKKQNSEKCAVKVIDKKRFVNFQTRRESHLSLQSEAEMLMTLKHPGITRFYEWFQTEDKLFIAMEFLPGGDVLQFILENGCFSENAARRLFKEIVNAVKYLHDKNIVHRDLKPENILLTCKDVDKMKPKLADFGLARKNIKTQDCKTFCGTPHYFAPEVIHTFRDRDQGQPGGYGKQADMWSLGVILYIMLSGIPPFEEEGLYEQILEGKYEFDVTEWNQVTPEAKELVRQLMTVNPHGRLTIVQAVGHKWFTLDPEFTPPDARVGEARRAPQGEDRAAKKPRADEMAIDEIAGQFGA